MTNVSRDRTRRSPRRRLDTTALKEHLEDSRVWAVLALVVDDEGDGHFDLDDEDVFVEVEFVPSEVRASARLMSIAGAPGQGIYRIPAVGTEVLVVIPDGEAECTPIIVGTLSPQELPDGVSEATTIIVGGEVQVRDKNGVAKPLATADHEHPVPVLVGASYGTGDDPTAKTGASDDNTTVLKGQ